MADTRPRLDPNSIDDFFVVSGNKMVPRGMAVAIFNNRVLWMGPAKILENVDVSGWPGGTCLNINDQDVQHIKDLVAKIEEGVPIS